MSIRALSVTSSTDNSFRAIRRRRDGFNFLSFEKKNVHILESAEELLQEW